MPNLPESGRVVAVLVAFNRRDLLVEALGALQAQTRHLDAIVVVDNASDDGSGEAALGVAPGIDLVTLTRNTGGAGGFAAGMAHALANHQPDWLWLMDDDTIPTETAAAELMGAVARVPGVIVAGSRVIWTDGQDHPMNTPRQKPFVSGAELRAAQAADSMPVRSSSFVSMLVSADAVRRHGLPVADYFIWNDDFEFSTRVLRHGSGIFVPSSVVVHKTKKLGATDLDPGERFFFEVRNKVWLMRFSRGLSFGEKILYSGSSLRRWVKTIRSSQERSVLRTQLKRGLAAGLKSRPRSNTEMLKQLGEVSDEIATVERALGGSRSDGGRGRIRRG